jgi:type IV pilus assembly protein PilO
MPRSFRIAFPSGSQLSSKTLSSIRDPRVLIRTGLGLLLVANLVAAGYAFNLFTPSPEILNRRLLAAQSELQAGQARLVRSRALAANIGKGKSDGDTFLATYFTTRRRTFSTIIQEIRDTATTSGMKTQEGTIGLDPIKGTDDLSMMTLSINFEGSFAQLVKFVNLIDRSPRFIIIESMQAAPQPKGDVVNTNLKMHVFVKDDPNGAL